MFSNYIVYHAFWGLSTVRSWLFLDRLLKEGELVYDKGWLSHGKDDEAFQSARYLELYEFAPQLYNSGVTDYEQLYGRLEQEVKKLNDGKIDRIVFNAMDGTSAGANSSGANSAVPRKKWFDSRRVVMYDWTLAGSGMTGMDPAQKMTPDEIKARKEAGELDRADIVRIKTVKNGMKIAELKDGSLVYVE